MKYRFEIRSVREFKTLKDFSTVLAAMVEEEIMAEATAHQLIEEGMAQQTRVYEDGTKTVLLYGFIDNEGPNANETILF